MHAVVGGYAVFDLAAEAVPELLVFLGLVLLHFGKSCLDFLFDICGYGFELVVMLEHLTADVE